MLAIVPHNLLIFPVLFFIGIVSLNLAKKLVQQRFGHTRVPLGNLIAVNIIALAASGLVLVVAGLIEAYISPFFIALLAKFMR